MCGVNTAFIYVDLGLIVVESDDLYFLCKFNGYGHAHIAKADKRQLLLAFYKFFIERHIFFSSEFG